MTRRQRRILGELAQHPMLDTEILAEFPVRLAPHVKVDLVLLEAHGYVSLDATQCGSRHICRIADPGSAEIAAERMRLMIPWHVRMWRWLRGRP
jgi:hypothetical protein